MKPSFHFDFNHNPANKIQIAIQSVDPDFLVPYNYYDPLFSCAGFNRRTTINYTRTPIDYLTFDQMVGQ